MSRGAPSFGRPVFPSPTGGRSNQIGLTPLRRCMQCGFPCDVNETAFSRKGEGMDENQEVVAGCPQCGSLNWQPSKPSKIKDDERTRNTDIKRRR
mgnify:CR=1 FL=1